MGPDLLQNLLKDKPVIAVHAVGCIGNLFIMNSLKEQHMSESILQALAPLLTTNNNPFLQKVVLQTLTIITKDCKNISIYFLVFF